jgi:hypothetical protein
MSPQVNDLVHLTFNNQLFNTKITKIEGTTLFIYDENSKINSTLTWNGISWLLPGNIPVTNVNFTLIPKVEKNKFTLPTFELIKSTIYNPTVSIPEFPYKRKFITENEIRQMFENLKGYNFQVVQRPYTIKRMPNVNKKLLAFGGQQLILNTPAENYNKYDNISDWFQEEVRMTCKRNDQTETPLQFWKTHQHEIKEKAKSMGEVNIRNLREAQYQLHYECTTFKPSLMVGFIKYLGSKRILDPFMGWSDRLIAAISQDDKIEYYVGIDSNSELFPGYKEIINFFIPSENDRKKYILIEGEFEKVTLPNLKYDLIFSSPPYYDLEEYSDKNQSYIGRNLEQWYNDFLISSLEKMWSVLEKNGFMVLHINDTYKDSYTERMINDIIKFSNAQYVGCLPASDLASEKNMNPIWIFKRN